MVRSENLRNELQFLDVIQFSCMTTKAKYLNEKQGQIIIYVNNDANKLQIKDAIQKTFGIEVLKVRIINVKGKNKISARRYKYSAKDRKKAIIILKDRAVASRIMDQNMQFDDEGQALKVNQSVELNKENNIIENDVKYGKN